jgi:hypothetical protein
MCDLFVGKHGLVVYQVRMNPVAPIGFSSSNTCVTREIVDRLYTFHLRIDDPAFRAEIDRWAAMTAN